MRGILVLAILTFKSSYRQNTETSGGCLDNVLDTVQWWFGDAGCWRIRTYAIDHDIHVHRIGVSPHTTVPLARENNRKNYGDVIKTEHIIQFVNCADRSEVEVEFGNLGLLPNLTIDTGRFAFWQPDERPYTTQSRPR